HPRPPGAVSGGGPLRRTGQGSPRPEEVRPGPPGLPRGPQAQRVPRRRAHAPDHPLRDRRSAAIALPSRYKIVEGQEVKHETIFTLLLLLAQSPAQDEKALEKAANDASDAFKKAFKGTEAEKIGAIDQVAAVQHRITANRLAGVLEANESTRVRTAAVKALGRFTEQKKPAATVLASALPAHRTEPGLFSAICSAMEDLKDPSVVPTLLRFFEDKDEAAATRTMEAAGKIGSSAAIDPLIG